VLVQRVAMHQVLPLVVREALFLQLILVFLVRAELGEQEHQEREPPAVL